jgi:multidrug efflux pump
MAPREAAIEAAGLRLRAIVMTSLAFGSAVPLAIATGPGAKQPARDRTGVIGGIIASTVIATSSRRCFLMLESASQRFGGSSRAPQR